MQYARTTQATSARALGNLPGMRGDWPRGESRAWSTRWPPTWPAARVPGVVALVSYPRHDERVAYRQYAFGTMKVGGTEPMRRDVIFRIASLTKPIVAVAAMILVEERKLRLDDAVDDFLPELANRRVLKRLDAAIVLGVQSRRRPSGDTTVAARHDRADTTAAVRRFLDGHVPGVQRLKIFFAGRRSGIRSFVVPIDRAIERAAGLSAVHRLTKGAQACVS